MRRTAVCALLTASLWITPAPQRTMAAAAPSPRAVLDQYCVTCHNAKLKTGGLALDVPDLMNAGAHADVWEKVVRKLRAGMMPPPGRPRPDAATYDGLRSWAETEIDRAASSVPDPGRT